MALIELEKLIRNGPNDPRELLHPSYDQMRGTAGFKDLQSLHVQRVNEERVKLGLTPILGG
jgi:hypothetical protein